MGTVAKAKGWWRRAGGARRVESVTDAWVAAAEREPQPEGAGGMHPAGAILRIIVFYAAAA